MVLHGSNQSPPDKQEILDMMTVCKVEGRGRKWTGVILHTGATSRKPCSVNCDAENNEDDNGDDDDDAF